MEKNDVVTVKIEDITEDGSGIGHINGLAVFVKDTIPGDEAEIKIIKSKKHYAFGKIVKLIEESPDRVEPSCEVSRSCGGCTIMQLAYAAQLEYKKNKVINCIARLGGIPENEVRQKCEGIDGMDVPFDYRNKMQFPVGKDKYGKPVIGFYAGRTHSIVPVSDCRIGHPVNAEIITSVREYMIKHKTEPYDEVSGRGLVRHILTRVGFHTNQLLVTFVINGMDWDGAKDLVKPLQKAAQKYGLSLVSVSLNINMDKTNRILGNKCITVFGDNHIEETIGNVKFNISPLSFFQVNPVQTEKLYKKVLEYSALTGSEKVWDLYSGIGTISLFLAREAEHVYGVEIISDAVSNAKENAVENKIVNADFFEGAAEEILPELYNENKEKYMADIVVVDPPRKGCDEKLLATIAEMQPERMVYVSCDPATLGRDIAYLKLKGFEVEKWKAVDMFPHTCHVETVVLMSRVEGK